MDPSIPSSASPGVAISRHEWTLLADMDGGRTEYLYPWRLITRNDADCAGVNDLPNKVRMVNYYLHIYQVPFSYIESLLQIAVHNQ